MKNTIFSLFAAFVLMGGTLFAQNTTDYRDQFAFGLKLGGNLSNVYDSEGESFQADSKLGLAAGAFVSIPIGTYIGIQPELLIAQKGFKATGSILGSSYSLARTTTWIDVPVLFAFKPSEFFTLVAGPQFSYLLKQKTVFENATTTIAQEQEFENESIRKYTLGMTGGADLTMKQFVVSGRAGIDLFKNNGDGSTTTPRYKNVWYQLTIGYRFYKG
jgi:hypothetical protein